MWSAIRSTSGVTSPRKPHHPTPAHPETVRCRLGECRPHAFLQPACNSFSEAAAMSIVCMPERLCPNTSSVVSLNDHARSAWRDYSLAIPDYCRVSAGRLSTGRKVETRSYQADFRKTNRGIGATAVSYVPQSHPPCGNLFERRRAMLILPSPGGRAGLAPDLQGLHHARQPGQVVRGRAELETGVGRNQRPHGVVDHGADLQQQVAAR